MRAGIDYGSALRASPPSNPARVGLYALPPWGILVINPGEKTAIAGSGRCRSPGRDPRGARRPRIAAKGPQAASYGACNRCKVVESYTSWSCGQDSRPGPNATGGAACATRREAGVMV